MGMTEFENVLQTCLHDLEQGLSNVDDCLHRYPNYARQLEPILLTSAYLERARSARLSSAFEARVRTKLIQQMSAHPRKPARSSFMFMRFAVGLAAVILALLAAGTVYAQGAFPGEPFYRWKLTSENTWRAISSDPVKTDLAIADRRANELIAVRDNPALYSQVLNAYLEVTDRLKSEASPENENHILTVLDAQVEELNRSGILLPQIDQNVLPPAKEPTLTPIPIPTSTPLPTLETPQVNPTNVPQIIPTVRVPTRIIPTVEISPRIVPTLHSPPNIAPETELPLIP